MSSKAHRELWLVRHGETPASRGRTLAGWTDVPLTERGQQQAAALRPVLENKDFDGVWSSDLIRAVTTARLAWGEPKQDRRLREMGFGELEGADFMTLEPKLQDGILQFNDFAAPGGESLEELHTRVMSFIDVLPMGQHLLFTHGGVVRLFARELGHDRFVPTGTLLVANWDSRTLLSVREGEGTPRDEKDAVIGGRT
jgi:probable phosphoglycerate mutase